MLGRVCCLAVVILARFEEKHIIQNLAGVNLAVSFFLSLGTYTVHPRQCIQYACVCLGKKSTAKQTSLVESFFSVLLLQFMHTG